MLTRSYINITMSLEALDFYISESLIMANIAITMVVAGSGRKIGA